MAARLELARIQELAGPHGLMVRGGFHPADDDAVPRVIDGGQARTLILLGNSGPAMWRAFSQSPEACLERHPLDAWSRRVIAAIAAAAGAQPLFPFGGPPHLPFARWAQRAEPVHVSPLGMLIHPEYGLWHAYRGALAFAERLDLPTVEQRPSPCASCATTPCLAGCPVGAFTSAGYDVPACTRHLSTPQGEDCMSLGCRARRACPIGHAYVYESPQVAFHMRAFLRAQRQA
jgi:ferredoxin